MNFENDNEPVQVSTEDLDFDRTNVSTTDTQPITDNEALSGNDPVDQSKQEELAANDFSPLTEAEKQPKIQEEDRIEEMNRRTSIGD